jgi:hypothetical protein
MLREADVREPDYQEGCRRKRTDGKTRGVHAKQGGLGKHDRMKQGYAHRT